MASRCSKSNTEQAIVQTNAEQLSQEHVHHTELRQSNVDGSSTITAAQNTSRNSFDSEGLIPIVGASFLDNDSSAARPAPKANDHAELFSLKECTKWLQGLPSQEILQSKPLQQLQEAMDRLQGESSRQQRQKIRQLLNAWNVPQKAQDLKRNYDEVKEDLVQKVVEETRRLKRMEHAVGEPSMDGSATNSCARFSAIRASLKHGSTKGLL